MSLAVCLRCRINIAGTKRTKLSGISHKAVHDDKWVSIGSTLNDNLLAEKKGLIVNIGQPECYVRLSSACVLGFFACVRVCQKPCLFGFVPLAMAIK